MCFALKQWIVFSSLNLCFLTQMQLPMQCKIKAMQRFSEYPNVICPIVFHPKNKSNHGIMYFLPMISSFFLSFDYQETDGGVYVYHIWHKVHFTKKSNITKCCCCCFHILNNKVVKDWSQSHVNRKVGSSSWCGTI